MRRRLSSCVAKGRSFALANRAKGLLITRSKNHPTILAITMPFAPFSLQSSPTVLLKSTFPRFSPFRIMSCPRTPHPLPPPTPSLTPSLAVLSTSRRPLCAACSPRAPPPVQYPRRPPCISSLSYASRHSPRTSPFSPPLASRFAHPLLLWSAPLPAVRPVFHRSLCATPPYPTR